ncbi:MAG: bifunctional phosphoglucose/phosphomannose isomerase [Aquificaceae bacterium]|nr:bifunctional phosphoglucose/phosphomannose isomerase [Aquificaceae bacterium]MDW8433866.1 bifunctional phosphoglucose/phosphomannose isomerase [Aquificaceae bacterium]
MDAYKMIEEFPEQLAKVECESLKPEDYAGIVFSGMGGSGIVGDFMKLFIKASVPVLSIRGYQIPEFVKDGWLLVCTSYSGNTEETISTLEEGLSRGLKAVCVSSGGKLKEIAQRASLPYFTLPQGYPPRYALGFMLSTLMCLFDMGEEVEKLRTHLKTNREIIKQQAQSIAKDMFTYLPVVYGTPLTETVAFRWKTQVNENSKTLCYNAVLPEMHHNEVVGLDNPQIRNLCTFTLLYDPEDHERVLKRVEITEQIFKELGVVLRVIKGEGENLAQRLLYITYLGDWVSLYLAEIYKQDPIPVRVIDFIKKSLS